MVSSSPSGWRERDPRGVRRLRSTTVPWTKPAPAASSPATTAAARRSPSPRAGPRIACAKPAANCAWQGAGGVRALRRQPVAAAGQCADDCLRQPLCVAATQEVAKRQSSGRDPVVNDCVGAVPDVESGGPSPNRQLGLLAAQRDRADPADLLAEPTDVFEHRPA